MFGTESFLFDTLLLIVALYALWLFGRRKEKSGEPPVVSYWIPWFGSGLKYNKDQMGFLRECEAKYGPIFTLYMGGRFMTFVVDPLTYPSIAKESKKLSFRVNTTPVVKNVFDFARVNVEQPTMGGLIPKYFQGVGLDKRVIHTMENFYDVLSEPWFTPKQWKEVDLYQFCFEVMFKSGTKTLFGSMLDKQTRENMLDILQDFTDFDIAFPLLAQGLPISVFKKAKQARQKFWKFLKSAEKPEALEMFEEHIEFCSKVNKKLECEKEHFAFWWASESNTVLAAFWTLYFVLKHPKAFEAAKADVEDMLKKTAQDPNSNFTFSRSQLDQMSVLDSIIKESMRLCVSSAMLRQAMQDININVVSTGQTFRIRKGDNVMIMFQLTHYDPEIYDDPTSFKYDRFLISDEVAKETFRKNGKSVRYHYQPFGSGLSKCPGRQWAVTEIKQFLSHLLVRYDLEMVDPEVVLGIAQDRFAMGTLLPHNKTNIRFKSKFS